MQAHELDAWLDGVALTDDQRVMLERAIEVIDGRYPGADLADAREQAASAALMVLAGDDTLEGIGRAWAVARAREREAMERLTGALAVEAVRGVGESRLAERAGVTRTTVRRALAR